jgi:hypothetical protein
LSVRKIPVWARVAPPFDPEERIKSFYATHILPFSGYPANERPEIWALIALSAGVNTNFLWSTDKNVVTRSSDYAAIGQGAMYARILMGRLHPVMHPLDVDAAKLLAAYVVYQVKECIDGCGKRTQLACIKGDEPHYVHPDDLDEVDKLFAKYSATEAEILRYVFNGAPRIGYRNVATGDISRWLKDLRKEIPERLIARPIRAAMQEVVERQYPQRTKDGRSPLPPLLESPWWSDQS